MKVKRFKDIHNILIIHGYGVNSDECFYPWLGEELESDGYTVEIPKLPGYKTDEQVNFILKNYPDKKDIIISHSMGGCVAMKLIEELDYEIKSLYIIAGFIDNNFPEGDEDIENLADACDWEFNFTDIKSKVENIYVIKPSEDSAITSKQTKDLARSLGVRVNTVKVLEDHACGREEQEILNFILDKEK